MAAAAGMETTLEFCPIAAVTDLPTALTAIRGVGRRDFRLVIDTMHFARTGGKPADLAALDPNLIGYVQLCDVKVPSERGSDHKSYAYEAAFQRMVPGTGDVPLAEILAAVPRDIVVSLEVPLRSDAEAGRKPRECLIPCVEATRALLAGA
jgi:sugar phosphate isomerase/epimerase